MNLLNNFFHTAGFIFAATFLVSGCNRRGIGYTLDYYWPTEPYQSNYNNHPQYDQCEEGLFVVGLRKRMKTEFAANMKIVNAIELTCSDLIRSERTTFNHTFGNTGTWGEYYECPQGFGVALTVQYIYPEQDTPERKIGNVTLHCQSVSNVMNSSDRHPIKYYDLPFQVFSLAQHTAERCTSGEGITSLKTTAKGEYIANDTVVKVMSAEIGCKKIKSPTNDCTFSLQYEKIPVRFCSYPYKFNGSSHGEYRVNCSIDALIGVSYNNNLANLQNILKSYYLQGKDITSTTRILLMSKLLETLKLRKLSVKENAAVLEVLTENKWKENELLSIDISREIRLLPGIERQLSSFINGRSLEVQHDVVVSQFVATCGIYTFRFPKFKMASEVYFNVVVTYKNKIIISN